MSVQLMPGEIRAQVRDLERIARDLYSKSDDFPAINRNLKRILASIEMLKLNVEEETADSQPV